MTKIGIIDADLIGRQKHRFPNLACEKISGYWKERGADVILKLDYDDLDSFDHVYISKVFTDTPIPDNIIETDKIHLGGTGFYFDKAPALPYEIEHHMPDYHLYDEWILDKVLHEKILADVAGKKFNMKTAMQQFKAYTDYSIGFLTRGCFRKCPFCVNQKYDKVFSHSPLEEFYDSSRRKICLLDDNFLGCPEWKRMLTELINLNKPFMFKQGLDERLLTDEKCEMLFNAKYDGDYIFAFDNVKDYDLIEKKLQLIRKYTDSKHIKFYVLTGFESTDAHDIENAFKRIALLMKYQCVPYLMRYQSSTDAPWKNSEYSGMYIAMASWCNQLNVFTKMCFREFCERKQNLHKTEGTLCAAMRALTKFEADNPDIARKYFDLCFEDGGV